VQLDFGDIFFGDMMAWNLVSRHNLTIAIFLLQIVFSPMTAMASYANLEQDFCVADLASTTIVNGLACKSTML
jgi:hypothetical protein